MPPSRSPPRAPAASVVAKNAARQTNFLAASLNRVTSVSGGGGGRRNAHSRSHCSSSPSNAKPCRLLPSSRLVRLACFFVLQTWLQLSITTCKRRSIAKVTANFVFAHSAARKKAPSFVRSLARLCFWRPRRGGGRLLRHSERRQFVYRRAPPSLRRATRVVVAALAAIAAIAAEAVAPPRSHTRRARALSTFVAITRRASRRPARNEQKNCRPHCAKFRRGRVAATAASARALVAAAVATAAADGD